MPVTFLPRRLAGLLIAVLLTVSTAAPALARVATPAATPAASPAGTTADAVRRGVAYLLTQQQPDGGFLGFSGTSDAGATTDAVLALAAAGKTGVEVDLAAAVGFLTANAEDYAETGPGQAAKLALAISAVGGDPRDVGGFDVVAEIVAGQDAESGVYGTGVYDHCLAMLALVAAAEPFADPAQTYEALRTRQIPDGSWSFDGTSTAGAGDSNTAAICVQALVAAGQAEDEMVPAAVDYLRSIQLPQGFPFQAGSDADANSTGLVVQALVAVGEDPTSTAWQNVTGSLLRFQNPSGAFRYTLEPPDDNLFATFQAIPAIAGQAFPILAVGGTPVPLPEPISLATCTAEQLTLTPEAGAELPCAA